MGWSTTVEEGWVGVVHNLCEDEVLVLGARSEKTIRRLVADFELRRLGNGVVVGTPHESDGITDGRVQGERNVTENTLCGCNNDGVSNTSTLANGVSCCWSVLGGRKASI